MNVLKKHKNLIPLIILGICCIYTFFNHFFNRYEASDGSIYIYPLSLVHYLALVAIVVDFLIYFFGKNYFKYAITSTIVLGLLNILVFLPVNINIMSIQALSFFMSLLYIFLNYGSIYKKGTKEAEKIDVEKVENLKLKYLEMSEEELLEIYEDKRFTVEAKMAVEQLLEGRPRS